MWDPSWQVEEEKSENGRDYLRLMAPAGQGMIQISAQGMFRGEPSDCVDAWRDSAEGEGITLQPFADPTGRPSSGKDTSSAFESWTWDFVLDDGSVVPLYEYYECQMLPIDYPNAIVRIWVSIPLAVYDAQRPVFDDFIDGIVLAEPGEPGPVFASGPWRVALVSAIKRIQMSDVGLDLKKDKQWVVVVLDVTNTNGVPQTFLATDVRILIGREMKPKGIAKRTTASVAETLGVAPAGSGTEITFEPGQTQRVVLVYQVGTVDRTPALSLGDAVLPITNATTASTSPFALMPMIEPAATEAATLIRVVDGNTVKVRIDATGEDAMVELIGVDAPVEEECYAGKAKTRLKKIVGETLLLEADSSVMENGRPRRYIWSVGEDGNLVQVNHAMVAAGNALVAEHELGSRFGAWIAGAADDAESDARGIWKACDEATQPTPAPTETPQVVTQWSGEINLLGTIEFTVADENLTHMRITIDVPCSVAGNSLQITATSNAVVPITDGTFSDEVRVSQHATGSLTGTITGESSAIGTISLPPFDGCTTTEIQQRWTASPE